MNIIGCVVAIVMNVINYCIPSVLPLVNQMEVGIQGAADTTIENCESSSRTDYSYRSIVTLFLCIYPLIVSKTYFSSGSLTSLFRKPLTICLVVISASPFPQCCVFTTYS